VEVDAKKEVFGAEAAWERLQVTEKVCVGRGQKVHAYLPDVTSKDEIMHEVLGRTGNLRAPTLKIGNSYYIGYNETMYKELML